MKEGIARCWNRLPLVEARRARRLRHGHELVLTTPAHYFIPEFHRGEPSEYHFLSRRIFSICLRLDNSSYRQWPSQYGLSSLGITPASAAEIGRGLELAKIIVGAQPTQAVREAQGYAAQAKCPRQYNHCSCIARYLSTSRRRCDFPRTNITFTVL